MEKVDFEKVFLSNFEFYELKKASKESYVIITSTPEHLLTLGFIRPHNSKLKNSYVITSDGFRYLEYLRRTESKETKEKRTDNLKYWISLIITNLISLAALIVSIIALLKK